MPAPAATTPAILSRVVLKDEKVPLSVLSFIPLPTAEKYQVSAFQALPGVVRLAIVYPEQLKQGFDQALEAIGQKNGVKIELYQTDAASMHSLIKQYKNQLKHPIRKSYFLDKEDPQPPLFKLGKTVALKYLKRIPAEFSRAHRVMCVDFLEPNTYWFVTDIEKEQELTALLSEIEQKNDINAYAVEITRDDFEELLDYYLKQSKQEAIRVAQGNLKQDQADHAPVVKESPPVGIHSGAIASAVVEIEGENKPEEGSADVAEQPQAKDVIVPDVQATIITSEQEKGGLAGLFQKITQGITGKKVEEETAAEEQKVADEATAAAKVVATQPATSGTPAAPGAPATPAPATPVQPAAAAIPAKKEGDGKQSNSSITAEDNPEIGKLLDKSVDSIEELTEHIKKGFIPRIVAAVVNFAIHEKASDIHIEAFEDEVRVRYRVDGQLLDVVKLPPDVNAAMVSRIKILSRLRLDETRVPQDGRFDVAFNDAKVDVRVSVMPTVHGEKVVMRILDKSKGMVSLDSLGILGKAYEDLVQAINKPFGICLATGPTGSGKSTSLYAILNLIATPNVNVITLEDPVEFEMKGINQSQIRPKIGFTFAEGLRAVLRQDPNIIMVGEIRDGETANMATQAALTGHLVLSTLHTNDAAGAIPRLSNMGIEPFLITSSLNVAVGQRLVRKICTNCKSPVNLPAGIQEKIAKDLEEIAKMNPIDAKRVTRPFKYYQGAGCEQCGGKGYRGRIGIYEVLVMNDEIEDLTLKHASGAQINEQAQKSGMLTMYQDGLLKVIAGITTLDEVLRESSNK